MADNEQEPLRSMVGDLEYLPSRFTSGGHESLAKAPELSHYSGMIKFLHTRIRVTDLEATISFYETLGFKLTRRTEKSPAGNQLAFLELEGNDHFLELCYSPDFKVEFPEDLMHTAVGVENIVAYCDEIEKAGIEIWPSDWREAFPSGSKIKMAFVTDPDGYEVEILER